MLRIVITTLSVLGTIALSLWAGHVQLFPTSTMAWYERPVQTQAIRLTSWLLNGMGMSSSIEMMYGSSLLSCDHPTGERQVITRGAMFGRSNTLLLPALLLACVASWIIVFTWDLGWIRRILILLSPGTLLLTPFVIGALYAVVITRWGARPSDLATIMHSHIVESTGLIGTVLVTAGLWWIVKAMVSTEVDGAAAMPGPARPPLIWSAAITTGLCAAALLLYAVVEGLLKLDSAVQFLLLPFLALTLSCLLLTLGLRGSAWGLKLSWIPVVPAALLAPAVGAELAAICLFFLVVAVINSEAASDWLTRRARSGCPSAGNRLSEKETDSRTPETRKIGGR